MKKNKTVQARSLEDPIADALTQPVDTGALMASYSVFVVEPGTLPGIQNSLGPAGQLNFVLNSNWFNPYFFAT